MSIYSEAVEVSKKYMGPAAEKFMARQLTALGVGEAQLSGQHLDELSQRFYTSGKLVMDDSKAQELSKKIKSLR